jgi:hypothetical protein
VPIPTQLLNKAHTPSLYTVAASLNVSLGAAVEPPASASAHSKSLGGAGSGPAGMLRGWSKAGLEKDGASKGAFRFFGNTVSSARVDLRLAKREAAGSSSRSGGDGAGTGEAGCGGAIGGAARAGSAERGRETTLCRVEFEKACELCLHSRQPLKNLNVVAELVVTVTNAQDGVDLSHESICWTIIPLTYASCHVLLESHSLGVTRAQTHVLGVSQFPVAAGSDRAPSSAKRGLFPRLCWLASLVALARNGHQNFEQKGPASRRSLLSLSLSLCVCVPARVSNLFALTVLLRRSVHTTFDRQIALTALSTPPPPWAPRCGKYHHAAASVGRRRRLRYCERAAGE